MQFSSLSLSYLRHSEGHFGFSTTLKFASDATFIAFQNGLTSFMCESRSLLSEAQRNISRDLSSINSFRFCARSKDKIGAFFQLCKWICKQQLLNILNSNDIKVRLNSLLQKKSIMFSHLDFSFLSFHSSPTAAAGILTAVGSITLLMTCSGADVFLHIYCSSPTFGAE